MKTSSINKIMLLRDEFNSNYYPTYEKSMDETALVKYLSANIDESEEISTSLERIGIEPTHTKITIISMSEESVPKLVLNNLKEFTPNYIDIDGVYEENIYSTCNEEYSEETRVFMKEFGLYPYIRIETLNPVQSYLVRSASKHILGALRTYDLNKLNKLVKEYLEDDGIVLANINDKHTAFTYINDKQTEFIFKLEKFKFL